MKKFFLLMSIALCALCFVACGDKSAKEADEEQTEIETKKNTPEKTVKRFYNALQRAEFEKACSETTLAENQQKAMAAMLEEKMTDEMKQEMKEMSYKVGKAKISDDGETATVEITSKDKDGKEESQEMKLKKIDGKWKISIDGMK